MRNIFSCMAHRAALKNKDALLLARGHKLYFQALHTHFVWNSELIASAWPLTRSLPAA
jgi:hypothetical protein